MKKTDLIKFTIIPAFLIVVSVEAVIYFLWPNHRYILRPSEIFFSYNVAIKEGLFINVFATTFRTIGLGLRFGHLGKLIVSTFYKKSYYFSMLHDMDKVLIKKVAETKINANNASHYQHA